MSLFDAVFMEFELSGSKLKVRSLTGSEHKAFLALIQETDSDDEFVQHRDILGGLLVEHIRHENGDPVFEGLIAVENLPVKTFDTLLGFIMQASGLDAKN